VWQGSVRRCHAPTTQWIDGSNHPRRNENEEKPRRRARSIESLMPCPYATPREPLPRYCMSTGREHEERQKEKRMNRKVQIRNGRTTDKMVNKEGLFTA
jgi:hypothetical protein